MPSVDDFQRVIDADLRPLGFRRQRLTWRRQVETGTQVVQLQRSQWGPQAYLAFGLWCGLLADKCKGPSSCEVQTRLDCLSTTLPEAIALESAEHLEVLPSEVDRHLLTWLHLWETSEGLAAFLRKPISRRKFLVAEPLRELARQAKG